jgi:(1->4)-alpha-D-glucan 1-alpha-D-glucosylmutase
MYRLQLRPGAGFHEAAALADYITALGITHAYLSPVLQAAPGSAHGYDTVDHTRLSDELGGRQGFTALVDALHDAGVGVVVDVVPNHMAIPAPERLNAPLWSVLREGPVSPYAGWFDIAWSAHEGRLLMPVLGEPLSDVLDAGELTLDAAGDEPVLRYHEHVFPLAAGTEELPLSELVNRQHYRLAHWQVGTQELNYRRFFDVNTLIGVRVEEPDVFTATHQLLVELVEDGSIDGLRVDHPDGLADPRGYLRRLADVTGGAWVVAEKILEDGEQLPDDWPCAGTTGYDALNSLTELFVDPAGERPLTAVYATFTDDKATFRDVANDSKRHVVTTVLRAEVARLTDLLVDICGQEVWRSGHTRRALAEAVEEILVAFPVYRAYVHSGEPPPQASVQLLDEAANVTRTCVPHRAAEVDLVRDLALGRYGSAGARAEFVTRFQQTCGPVMAKGVEDTAFYRWPRFLALNEVGGNPARFGVGTAEFHARNVERQREWPVGMTALSTHDTKRGEDVRARLAVLSELPDEWAATVREWWTAAAPYRSTAGWPDATAEYLLWQTLVGAWPLDVERAWTYAEKAAREAKRHTSWTDPDPEYDDALRAFVGGVFADAPLMQRVATFVNRIAPYAAANTLAQKLVQLTMPGVPDVYQGTEAGAFSLVDPDNRRPVDFDRLRRQLAELDAGARPAPASDLDAAKLLVTSRALRLRRDHPEWFDARATYEPLVAYGPAAAHVVAFARARHVVAVAPRLPLGLERAGGWRDTTIELPPGNWRDVLTGARQERAAQQTALPVAELLAGFPVALLVQ